MFAVNLTAPQLALAFRLNTYHTAHQNPVSVKVVRVHRGEHSPRILLTLAAADDR